MLAILLRPQYVKLHCYLNLIVNTRKLLDSISIYQFVIYDNNWHDNIPISASGKLLTFGENEGGKLGLGENPSNNTTPQKVDIPGKVTWVACGGTHTVAVTGMFVMA